MSGIGYARRGSRPYRKYRPLPALLLIALLGSVSVFVWLKAIAVNADIDAALRCDPPPTPQQGEEFSAPGYDALDDVSPIPPDKVAVRVLNASGARGKAALTTETLRQLGFTEVGDPGNDPAYVDSLAQCRGQIRFGENGTSAARTLSLVEACVELIKDTRKDASVDLVVGVGFNDLLPRTQAREILDQLAHWSDQRSSIGDGELSAGEKGPTIEPELLEAARPGLC